ALPENVGRGAHGLVMKEPVEHRAAPGNRRLDHEYAPARPQHPRGLAEEDERKFEMMQHVDHDDIGGAGVRERQPPGTPHRGRPRTAAAGHPRRSRATARIEYRSRPPRSAAA